MQDFSRFYDDMADIMPKILMDRTNTPCRTRKVAKFLPFVRIFPCTRLTGIIFGQLSPEVWCVFFQVFKSLWDANDRARRAGAKATSMEVLL